MSEIKNIRHRTKRVPPEGGFGYVVMLAVALPMGLCWGVFLCFGMMFNDFLVSVGAGTSAVSIIMGFLSIAISFSALFANTLNKILSLRSTAILGGILFFIGSATSIFATSVEYLIVSYGIILGCGMGFMVPTSFGTLNEYFVERRVLMMSITQSITSAVMVIYPILVQSLLNRFGFRGAMAVIAAINGNAILGMLAMHPVKWHYKVINVPVDEEESQPFMNSNVIDKEEKNSRAENLIVTCVKPNEGLPEDNQISVDTEKKHLEVLNEEASEENFESMPIEHHDNHALKESIDVTQRRFSMASVTGNVPIMLIDDIRKKKTGRWAKMADFLDLSLMKDFVYMNITFGVTFALLSDGFFFTLQPMYLYGLNISKDDTALIMAIGGGFDLGSRIFLSVASCFFTMRARSIYLAGVIASVVFRFAFLEVFDFMGLAIVSAFLGFFKTFIHLPTPIVFAEHLATEKFASGYGLFMFLQGIVSFLISPLIGWVRDVTKSYVICFHMLTFILYLCAIMWLSEFAWFRLNRRKMTAKTEKLSQKQMNI